MDHKKLGELHTKYTSKQVFIVENLLDTDLDQQLVEHIRLENLITSERQEYSKLSGNVLKLVKGRKNLLMEEKEKRLPLGGDE